MGRGRPKKYLTEEELRKAHSKARNKWISTHLVAIAFRFDPVKYSDVIARIKAQENKTQYIIKLVREDIKKNGNL